jgi:gliding motility-associated-like protein
MKKSLFIIFMLFQSVCSYASHITGGEMYYTYMGPSPLNAAKLRYKITLVLYKDTTVTGANVASLGSSMYFSIFRGDNNQHVEDKTALLVKYEYLNLTTYDPCLSSKPRVSYSVATYETFFDVDPLAAGYYAANSQCCRIAGVFNMVSTQVGATYWVKIPGLTENVFAPNNSNAFFNKKDTILVCKSSPVNIDFSATDPDGDILRYRFVNGYIGAASGPTQAQITPITANSPVYQSVTYINSFSGVQPLGPSVVIDSITGMVSGIAPDNTGIYLIAVLAEEYRNGIKISEHRKEFQVKIENCSITSAELKPSYITCNGYTLAFENQSGSSDIVSYLWDFGEKNVANPTSTQPTPTHTYSDTGIYNLKLKVTSSGGCQDSTTAPVSIFPGFVPDFTVQGSCFLNAYQFKDATTSPYGAVNNWRWDFGDTGTAADTARSKDSAWTYASPQTVNVTLISSDSRGCIDTITKPITILDRPQLNLPFRDTLICSVDTLALRVNIGSGTANWTVQSGPNQSRIVNPASTSPLVFPRDTTKYYITANENGCINTDSVTVNVLQFISVDLRDTGICRTDTFRLQPVSHALSYQWTASTGETIQGIRSPLVRPLVNTQYNVVANLGKCEAKDSMQVTVAPYPLAAAGQDQIICYGTRVQLAGTITGSSFNWSPTSSLVNQNTLTPTAGPTRTTTYILTATNTAGCLKPKSDTIVVTVIPPITAYAGRDTTIAAGQPLQLEASGGTGYVWTPTTGLNNPNIYNPIATLDDKTDSITYTVRVSEGSCFADDQVVVRVFKTGADILVPSGFTPNGDGRNDDIKPFTVGISQLTYFSIYNRWGQLIFTTSQIGKTWDGNFNGVKQPPGTYVYQALGIDFAGNSIYRKGTVVLIR